MPLFYLLELLQNRLLFSLKIFLGGLIFAISWAFAGFSVIGQPHIMVRFMAMDRPESMTRVRFYYYGWYVVFYTLTIIAALAARLLLPDTANFDQELALPMLAKTLAEHHGFKCTVLFGLDKDGYIQPGSSRIPGMAALDKADMMFAATPFAVTLFQKSMRNAGRNNAAASAP